MKRQFVRIVLIVSVLLSLGLVWQTASAQSSAVWSSEFFNNGILQGPPTIQRQDSAIAFNWGAGSPDSRINSNNFSARFGADVELAAGTYRFYVLADDGVQLNIDFNNLIINTFNQARPAQVLTGDITLAAGTHHLQLDYRENSGDAYVFLSWANLATNPSGPNFPVPAVQPPAPVASGSWTAQYFSNPNLSGAPTAIQSEISPSHNWGTGAPLASMPADNFSARWTSIQTLDGRYEVSVRADDGVRVFVDGVTYVNEWHGATGQTYVAQFNVPAGAHTITVEYLENGGAAFLDYNLRRIDGGSPQPAAGVGWTAQYYSNANLSGAPTAVRSENGPSRDWGAGAPLAGMPADNFSVRWTSVQSLTAGTYQITVSADDGVRVFVDGVARINEWHRATGQIYTATFALSTGNHNFMIEYFEEGGRAFIQYGLVRVDNFTPYTPPTGGIGNASGIVSVATLNVRNAPNTLTGAILTRATRGLALPIIGRNVDSSWWQVNHNGVTGWVSGRFVVTSNIQNVPITDTAASVSPPATGFALTATANVNIRSGPTTGFRIVGLIPETGTAQILGRNADSSWWQINYNGVVGWVSGRFVRLQGSTDASRIPVVN